MVRRCCRKGASSKTTRSPLISTVPESGCSRPAMILSRVDLPPPDGPISASVCTFSSWSETSSSAGWPSNRLQIFWRPSFTALGLEAVPFFQVARPKGNGQRQNEVAGGQRQIALQRAVSQRADAFGVPGEFADGNNRKERGVLDQRHKLAGQRRQ